MTVQLSPRVCLGGTGQSQGDRRAIPPPDAERQQQTAAEILRRLERQPGVILADEVGMGKTYVALAVAVSIADAPGHHGPVIVKVPASVKHKWPQEWVVFRQHCLLPGRELRVPAAAVTRASDLLKLLDDPIESRAQIIFVTHEAFTNSLTDPFMKLALISRALRRRGLERQREAFPRWAADVIGEKHFKPGLVEELLHSSPFGWKARCGRHGLELDDDPVPQALVEALGEVDLRALVALLGNVPLRDSLLRKERVRGLRDAVRPMLQGVWKIALRKMQLRLPLLVLDEAHHVKNSDTQLARLLANPPETEGEGSGNRGALGGVFDRMLFLTATPFQLRHTELARIVGRFDGVSWGEGGDRAGFRAGVKALERELDATYAAALRLDAAWGRLRPGDLPATVGSTGLFDPSAEVGERFRVADAAAAALEERVRAVERVLRPWVIRHSHSDRDRRRSLLPGRAIVDGVSLARGLDVCAGSVLPFLLAARAQALEAEMECRSPRKLRAHFAEGLASSFEAYRETRRWVGEPRDDVMVNEDRLVPGEVEWYLRKIDEAFEDEKGEIWAGHPKVEATTRRVVELWKAGEKVLVFCFFRATCRALRRHISAGIEAEVVRMAARQLGLREDKSDVVLDALRMRAERLEDPDSRAGRFARREARSILESAALSSERLDEAVKVVLRFLQTASFQARYVDLSVDDEVAALERAFRDRRRGPLSFGQQVRAFAELLGSRTVEEREELLEALRALQTGAIHERGAGERDDEDEDPSRGRLLPNVRLANGAVKSALRRRMLLCFNTCFFPEVLVASSVMGEGVDLHLACRHVIHHDLDWNPSVLEQRTGRLDRLGSLAEQVGLPVVVFEPFIEGTQDEKQFRVVKDRERWFNIVMGQRLELDEWSTEKLADRVPLPAELAARLTVDLAVWRAAAAVDQGPTLEAAQAPPGS